MISKLTNLTELACSEVDIKIQIQKLTSLLLRSWNHAPKQYWALYRASWTRGKDNVMRGCVRLGQRAL